MSQAKTGILLANLGTPEAPTPAAVKRYLRQFLSDTRVVDTPRLLWWPLLRGVILPIRSPRVAKLYQSVWMEEGSPLMVYSRRQEKALAARLPDMPVALGMSYGKPSLESAVDSLLAQGVEHCGAGSISAVFVLHGSCRLGRTGAHSGDPPPYTGYHLYPRLRR